MNQRRKIPWERDELILALDLYINAFRGGLPASDEDPRVIELSELLRSRVSTSGERPNPSFRSQASVRFKLANFRALDPEKKSGGFGNYGGGDERIWQEFSNDPERLNQEANAIRAHLGGDVEMENVSLRSVQDNSSQYDAENPSDSPGESISTFAISRAIMMLVLDGYRARRARREELADVVATGRAGEYLLVLVRGTVPERPYVIISGAEVELASRSPKETALFIVSDVEARTDEEGRSVLCGGRDQFINPWNPRDWRLEPDTYRLDVP